MLQLQDVRKTYTTAEFTQVALDDISVSFRDNEFVAILGPSGSGKTTLLNIVGGLDHYDSGNLVIDGIDTSNYSDRDWDTYRNNRIGFVFQSYNLIPHQTVLSNVELALTLSGVSATERHQRAVEALTEVGLQDHVHKLPSQLSGGQMQRVAIARALINDPEILLADEPTGALDSSTSVQIMGLLTEIANDRLVIMVTHNPELAAEYATRIVNLKDGKLVDDSDPFFPHIDASGQTAKQARKTSMSFLTAISLSFNNLMTKKGRTLMTAFAGSIGIIGIAAILALANGVNDYIKSIEEDTLSVYPLTIQSQGLDMTALLATSAEMGQSMGDDSNSSDGSVHEIEMLSRMFATVGSNDLASLKQFFDGNGGNISDYANSIQYSYNVTPQIFSSDTSSSARQVNPDTSFSQLGFGSSNASSSFLPSQMSTNVFNKMLDDTTLIEQQYDLMAGHWPESYDETVLVLTPNGGVSDFVLYAMDLRDPAELETMVRQMVNGEPIVTPERSSATFSYEEIMSVKFKLVNATDFYAFDSDYNVWTNKSADKEFLRSLVNDGEDLKISGIVQARSGSTATALTPGIYYTSGLITHLIEQAADSEIVQAQLANPSVNVFSGRTFVDEAENPNNSGLDLSKLVSVDSAAITNAFTFDESKLTLDTSSLQLDMPDISFDPSTMPELELGDLLGDLDLGSMMEGIDFEDILANIDLEGIDLNLDPEALNQIATDLATGYAAYCAIGNDCTDPATSFQSFLETPEGTAILADLQDLVGDFQSGLEGAQQQLMDQVLQGITSAVEQQLAASSEVIQAQIQAAMSTYMEQVMQTVSQQIELQLGTALERQIGGALETAMGDLATNMSSAMGIDEAAFLNAFQFNLSEDDLTQVVMSMMASEQTSFEGNLARLGYADLDKPSGIDIFPKDFESKGQIIQILDDYNAKMKAAGADDKVITYTDLVGTLMGSVTDIVNVVSYVLVAFVAISLVVSSIMIGVITYISVLERKKEIGILRSIGASKRDIRWVFNAETLIVGFVAGAIGILVTLLLTFPANAIVEAKFNIHQVAILPWEASIILVVISMGLTFLAGLIPASAASRKDPVEALRSE